MSTIGMSTNDLLTGVAGLLLCAVVAAVAIWRRSRERVPTLRDVERERKAERRQQSALAHSLRELAEAVESGAAQATERAEVKLAELTRRIAEADARIETLRSLLRRNEPHDRPDSSLTNAADERRTARAVDAKRGGSIAPAVKTASEIAPAAPGTGAAPRESSTPVVLLHRAAERRDGIVAALASGGTAGRIARELRVPLGEVELLQELGRYERRTAGINAPPRPAVHEHAPHPVEPGRN
ncbi:MAG: hypothetical protein IPM64_04145 [Phycisphaerales bacterium]|nr:hypothetical protein [Phycisphaerales bacterium]